MNPVIRLTHHVHVRNTFRDLIDFEALEEPIPRRSGYSKISACDSQFQTQEDEPMDITALLGRAALSSLKNAVRFGVSTELMSTWHLVDSIRMVHTFCGCTALNSTRIFWFSNK